MRVPRRATMPTTTIEIKMLFASISILCFPRDKKQGPASPFRRTGSGCPCTASCPCTALAEQEDNPQDEDRREDDKADYSQVVGVKYRSPDVIDRIIHRSGGTPEVQVLIHLRGEQKADPRDDAPRGPG